MNTAINQGACGHGPLSGRPVVTGFGLNQFCQNPLRYRVPRSRSVVTDRQGGSELPAERLGAIQSDRCDAFPLRYRYGFRHHYGFCDRFRHA